MLEALAAWNADLIRNEAAAGRPVPPIYKAGVRYERERTWTVLRNGHLRVEGREDWLDCLEIIALRRGDCEDLACWRVGELRAQGLPARVLFSIRPQPGGARLFHIIVDRGDGRLEDPSRALGMHT